MKVARTVLNGESGGNAADLHNSSRMRDFTPGIFKMLLTSFLEQDYSFQSFLGYCKNPESRTVILRHDVDARKMNSLSLARMENELGIKGTYYFRIVPESFDKKVIKQIYDLGHEIGYHYEDLSSTFQIRNGPKLQWHNRYRNEKLILETAIDSFRKNLEKLREIVPVETICMHGSPFSRWDNRLLWNYYNYRNFGIVGEPYFDIDFEKVLYLTDTGRRWDGDTVSIRDKTPKRNIQGNRLHSTFDIINAVSENKLPDKLMLTIHPQRWDEKPLLWFRELVWQNVKNIGKWILNQKNNISPD